MYKIIYYVYYNCALCCSLYVRGVVHKLIVDVDIFFFVHFDKKITTLECENLLYYY